MKTPKRPALRYHGSKWLLAKWIISQFPPHECYVEPFGGGAGVLLRKSRSWLEVYNDKDHQVVNFFRVLREQPDDLIRTIELTPYAKAEWEQALVDDPDPVEAARRLYIRAYMNIAGPTAQWKTGWRRQKVITKANGKKRMTPAATTFMRIDHLYDVADRLRGVQIECDDALSVIERYDSPETLFYIDPPYPSSTRGRWKNHAYAHEMTDDQHRELATVLRDVRGMVIISSYRCELYDELYTDWQRRDKKTRVNGPGHAIESVWLSDSAIRRELPLFSK
ncbi:MAG: DNA adenine methylase [Chloroflexi bacterium]|nr:DNA adenine methylase [Chloroflexota bacterium]